MRQVATRRIARSLYRTLLRLHPPEFRDEMLGCFDAIAPERTVARELVSLVPIPVWVALATAALSIAVLIPAGARGTPAPPPPKDEILSPMRFTLTKGPCAGSVSLNDPLAIAPTCPADPTGWFDRR
jgi:hypothetical protein